MSGLDDLIQQSAAEIPDFSDVSGGASFGGSSAALSGLDALIHASAVDLSGPTPGFSDVAGGSASSARSLPEQSAPPAPGGLDPAFMHWYSGYVKNTGAALSYDQARQLYKSLTPEQRAQAKAASTEDAGSRMDREMSGAFTDFGRNVASGMKQGADFVAHVPDYVARGVASIPFSVNAALEESDRRHRMEQAAAATNATGEDYVTSEQRRQATAPIPQMPSGSMLPELVEGTFESARSEREALAEKAAREGAEGGLSPESAALTYAVPQALGNALDPTLLLGGISKGAKAAETGASWLDRLIARGAEEELGVHAVDAAEPALAHVVEPSAELRQRFPEAAIDSREYIEPAGRRAETPLGQPLPPPPAGIKPGEPWLQRPIETVAAPTGSGAESVDLAADVPLTRWENAPGGVNPRRGDYHFWKVGDSDLYFHYANDDPASTIGGLRPRLATVHLRNPLFIARPDIPPGDVTAFENAVAKKATEDGHDVVFLRSLAGETEVMTLPNAKIAVREMTPGGARTMMLSGADPAALRAMNAPGPIDLYDRLSVKPTEGGRQTAASRIAEDFKDPGSLTLREALRRELRIARDYGISREDISAWRQFREAPAATQRGNLPPKIIALRGAGQAIADNLYDGMWSRLEAGKLPEPFPVESQSPAARMVAEAYTRGELKGPEDIRAIMDDYARKTYGKDEANAALRPEKRLDGDQQAPVGGALEGRYPASGPGGLEGQGKVDAAGAGPAGYRGPEGDLAPGAEGAGGPQSGQPLAPGRGAEALPASDGRVAEGAGGPESLVTVNDRTYRLTEEGRARWDVAQADYDRHVQWANHLDPESRAKQLKAAGMRLSAKRRQITGALTGREAKAAAEEPLKLRFGKDVTVYGQPAKIVGAPFGKVKVRFEDGTERLVARDAVSVVSKKAPVLAEEVIPPIAKPFPVGELPESLPLPEEEPFAPGELPGELPQLTSLKKAYSEPERAERRLTPVEREFFGTTDETMARARDVVDADPTYPRQLARDLIDQDRPPRPHEVAELLYDKAKILKEEKAAMDALEAARASGDEVAKADAREVLARARGALDANTEASRRSLAQWGEAGRLSQLVIREDYSTSQVLQRARTAAATSELPPELEKKLTDLSTRVETTSAALDEAKDQLAQMRAKKALAAMQRETQYEGRKAARRQVKQTLEEELADLSGQLEKRAAAKQGKLFSTTNPFQGLDPESIAIIGKIAKNRVKAGVNTVEDLVDSVFQVVKNHFDGITPRDVRDAISGYGNAPKGSRAVAESQLSRVKREMRLLSKIEDAEAGKMPIKGATPRKPAPHIKALEKRLRQEMRSQGLDRNMRLDAYHARLETRKADLERQLATGDFTPAGRPLAVEDASTRKLKVEIEGLKSKIDTEVKRLEKANRTPGEKVRDLFLKWRRATLLSSSQTVGKLLSAAETRTLVTTPVEQLIGAGWAHVPGVSRIAALAPREGTVSLNAEAKAWASAFSKETWKDAWETGMPGWAGGRGTGKGELDILYGKKSDFPPEVLDFFGHLHAGLKTLAKRPEFERSLALRYKHAAMHGIDTTLPEVQAEIASKAYADSMRAVLLQDNALVDGFRAFQGMLRKRGATGTAAATDFFLPIVKVPSNYVTEAAEYGFGPARALTRVIWKGGIENLEEQDAEYIMRNLKKGTLGTSLLALGYYGFDNVGGYRQRNEHREEGDVQPMTIRMNLFGNKVDIPHALLHAPALEMVQVGATLRRLQNAYADRGKEHGTLAGELAGTRGLLEQVPFYGELLRTQEGLESPTGFHNYMGNLGRSIFIPPDIQRAAKVMDQPDSPGPFAGAAEQLGLKHFEATRRYPQNFLWDQFKVGIPWAREQVSDEKNP